MIKEVLDEELLTELLDLDTNLFVDSYTHYGNILEVLVKKHNSSKWATVEVNIYELAFKKCKDWAISKGWHLFPSITFEDSVIKYGCSIMKPKYYGRTFKGLFSIEDYDERDYLAYTEVEATLKACKFLSEFYNRKRKEKKC